MPASLPNPITINHRSTDEESKESNHRSTLIQFARIACRHVISAPRSWIIIVRIERVNVSYVTSDLRRLAICQNRAWLWDLFPKRSRTISLSPPVFRLFAFSIRFGSARPVLFSTDVSTHRGATRASKRMERCLSPLEKTGNATATWE